MRQNERKIQNLNAKKEIINQKDDKTIKYITPYRVIFQKITMDKYDIHKYKYKYQAKNNESLFSDIKIVNRF